MGNCFVCTGLSREDTKNENSKGSCLCCVQTPDPGDNNTVSRERKWCDCHTWWRVCCWKVGG
jgi:hypothetical protein